MYRVRMGVLAILISLALGGCTLTEERNVQPELEPVTPNETPQGETPQSDEPLVFPELAEVDPTPLPQELIEQLNDEERVISNVYLRVAPAVVRIQTRSGLGSGFLIDADTFPEVEAAPDDHYIVTNSHVVQGSGGEIVVFFSDLFAVTGTVVGADPDSDLAVVRVDDLPEDVEPIELGSSEDLNVGQRVIAIGNPFGQDRTVTTGIVSAIGRTIPGEPGGYAIGGAIQTDAAINPGNSGGPLLDLQGRVLGVNTAILSRSGVSAGVGFAVPVELVKKVVPALITEGQYLHPFLGVRMAQITTLEARLQNLPSAGVLIAPISRESPVFEAGLRDPAILTTIEGTPVTSADQLISYLELNTRPGETVTLTVIDEAGEKRELEVELEARPTVTDREEG
ncbi:MAG: 2-alkenal reductase [Herpetosiphonaceae bacterium]|nr:MAG: 2-alkenal reductase [Herpetosiphonaceae bacterium]